MKALVKPRINLEGRTALETVIPLSTPYIVFFDPSSACNFQCTFCPTGHRDMIRDTGRYQGLLSFDLFQKVIDELELFPEPLRVLRLYKDGEPLLNRRLGEMIAYAKKSSRVPYVDTTTNVSLLHPLRSDELIKAGLDKINISIDGMNDEQYLSFTKTKVRFADIVANVRYFYQNKGNCEVAVKIADNNLTDTDKKRFFDTFGNIADRIFIENFAPCWPEFDTEKHTGIKITKGIYQNEIKEIETCPYIFYSISINSSGLVSLCFLDWARKLVIGDIGKQTLREVWEGEELFLHQVAHLSGDRKKNPTCAACGQITHCKPDNIDPYAATLLKNLLAHREHKNRSKQVKLA